MISKYIHISVGLVNEASIIIHLSILKARSGRDGT